jgi:predicted nuclease with TOPRIM domain
MQKTVFAVDELQADLQAICDAMIETGCALEETEEKNAELTLRNAELEQMIAQLKAEMLEKSHRIDELQSAFEKRQCDRNKYWSGQVRALEDKLKSLKSAGSAA